MKLVVNGSEHEVASGDLAAVLTELDFGSSIVATAVNGDFVPAAARTSRTLAEGDRVEIVAPRQGG